MVKIWCKFVAVLGIYAGLWCASTLPAQGLIVNEASNGPGGNQEFYELVVIGPNSAPNCGPVDISGWIVDDNNGDFSCGPCINVGIANGHIRFGTTGAWSAVPTGSIIVLYDPATKNPKVPADDPNDTAPADGVYILPTNHASIDVATTPCAVGLIPSSVGACTTACTGNAAYAGACYAAGLNNVCTGLRNNGDAAQVRAPGGAYYHGIGYGTAGSLMNGGPDNLFISGDGTGKYYAFLNTVDNNYRSSANFASANVSSNGETPGVANSVLNAAWIASLTVPCLLSVTYQAPLAVRAQEGMNLLTWTTITEVNADHWKVMRATTPDGPFEQIGEVAAHGNSHTLRNYNFEDRLSMQSDAWYRIIEVDADGALSHSEVVKVSNGTMTLEGMNLWPNPSNGTVHLRTPATHAHAVEILDMLGRVCLVEPVMAADEILELTLDVSGLEPGHYVVRLRGSGDTQASRLVVQPQH